MPTVRVFLTRIAAPLLLALLAMTFLPPRACAGRDWVMGDLADVQVRIDGRPAPLYPAPDGGPRRYLEACAGRNYSIRVRNRADERIGVLITADGINVLSGKRSTLSPDEQMYVLEPNSTADVEGWRTSLDDIQRFVFEDENASYAVRTGQANGDLGWIRVHVFRERRFASPKPGVSGGHGKRHAFGFGSLGAGQMVGGGLTFEHAKDAGGPATEGTAPSPKSEPAPRPVPGTGWGEQVRDHVEMVAFVAERTAADVAVFRYEYASGLHALGIEPHPRSRVRERDAGDTGFAQPPR